MYKELIMPGIMNGGVIASGRQMIDIKRRLLLLLSFKKTDLLDSLLNILRVHLHSIFTIFLD